jgi:hypothetical protein
MAGRVFDAAAAAIRDVHGLDGDKQLRARFEGAVLRGHDVRNFDPEIERCAAECG